MRRTIISTLRCSRAALFLLLLLVGACGENRTTHEDPNSDSARKRKLVGTWQSTNIDWASQTFTYQSDGTYTGRAVPTGFVDQMNLGSSITVYGTWDIKDGALIQNQQGGNSSSFFTSVKPGRTSDHILELTAQILRTRTQSAKMEEFRRLD